MAVRVTIDSGARYKVDRAGIRQVVERTVRDQGVVSEAEVNVSMVGERKMKELHEKYMETYEATDVLSFPLEDSHDGSGFVPYPDKILRLGDIVVCYPVAVRQAGENNRMVDEEIAFLVEHGCLHLLGVHHEE